MSAPAYAWRAAALVLLLIIAGCAPAYHAYRRGCVPYGYAAPPPLPYQTYHGCPTPVATKFQQTQSSAEDEATGGKTDSAADQPETDALTP